MNQFTFLRLNPLTWKEELIAYMDEDGYVYGTVPGDESLPVIGLIAHMDTAPGCSGANIKPRIVDYKGGDIVLNEELGLTMTETDFPSL